MAVEDDILIQIIISIAASVGGGTVLGYILSERRIRAEEKKLIEKIHGLLNHDFDRLFKLIHKAILEINKIKKTLEDDADFTKKMISREIDHSQTIRKITPYLIFNYWAALDSSGSLIKLEQSELQFIFNAHLAIEGMGNQRMEEATALKESFNAILQPSPSDHRINLMKEKFTKYLKDTESDYLFITKTIQKDIKGIPWWVFGKNS